MSRWPVVGKSWDSLSEPMPVLAGRIRPRAPRRVFSHSSVSCMTEPNSVGLLSLPLRIGRASGSVIETSRSLIGWPASRSSICAHTFSASSQRRSQPLGGGLLGPGATPARTLTEHVGEPTRLPDGLFEQLAGLAGQPQRQRAAVAGSRSDRPVDAAQPTRDRARAVPDPRSCGADQTARSVGFAREGPRGILGHPEVGRIANVGLHDGRIDASGANHEAPSARARARRRGDHLRADVLDHVGAKAAHELDHTAINLFRRDLFAPPPPPVTAMATPAATPTPAPAPAAAAKNPPAAARPTFRSL